MDIYRYCSIVLAPGTWRWMVGVDAIPAALQFLLMLVLPESPRWLYRKGRKEESIAILERIYHNDEVQSEFKSLSASVDAEINHNGPSEKINWTKLFTTKTVRQTLIIGVGLQFFRQFIGSSTVMYYTPATIELSGFASHKIVVLLSLITTGLNVMGFVISIFFIDRAGRKKLMIISLLGIMMSLDILAVVFHETIVHSPTISAFEVAKFIGQACPAYQSVHASWDYMECLKASSPSCGFCTSNIGKLKPGACLISNSTTKALCEDDHRLWYTTGCPSKFGWVALIGLGLYIIYFSPGMGIIPWIVNSEIYPVKFGGVCGGIAATVNWTCNLIVAQTFLTMTQTLGTAWTFLIFDFISIIALVFVVFFVPETKGLPIEEVEKILQGWSFSLYSANKNLN